VDKEAMERAAVLRKKVLNSNKEVASVDKIF